MELRLVAPSKPERSGGATRGRPSGSGFELDERPAAALIPNGLAGKAGLRP
jgi:hypothetical protein